ncbi:MAG: cell division protein FtsA [Fimbriimonadales bacterium]
MSTFAAIDIGATKVAVVVAEIDDSGNPRLIGFGETPNTGVKRGHVVDIDSAAEAVSQALRKAERMSGKSIRDITVAISGDAIRSSPSVGLVPILNPTRTITREDVHRVINHSKQTPLPKDRELILAVPRSYRVDGQTGVVKPVGMSGQRLEAETLLVTAPTHQLDNLQKSVRAADAEVDSWVPKALASGEAVTTTSDRETGVAVIDIGGDSTDVAVYQDGSVVFLKTLPVGAQNITNDISILLKTTLAEAERLKQDASTCGNGGGDETVYVEQAGQRRPFNRKVLNEIVTARAKEILLFALEAVEEAADVRQLRSGLVLSGGGAKLKGIDELAKSLTGNTPVRIGIPEPFEGLGDLIAAPQYATAAGLIRFGARLRDQEGVAAETGDFRKLIKSFSSIFSGKSREDGTN